MSKQIKLRCCLLFYGFEPLDCGGGAFPLVEFGCSHDFAVNSVEDSFADLAYLRFGGVDQSAGWFIGEVRFVVFEGYECLRQLTKNNIEANKKIISFLDVTFNLNNSTYQPYTKPNSTLQ